MRLVKLLCLLCLLRLLVPLDYWRVFFACKSGESAWSGEFAVPALPCETCVSASVVPGESAVSPTVCWFFVHISVWRPSWIRQVPV